MKIDDFEVTALFYTIDNLKFRRYLEIRRKAIDQNKNDLSVIMMNPGSSKPKDIDEKNDTSFLNKFVITHPDPTQFQIMEIMDNCNFNYAKIINLSDIRNGNSNDFYKMLSAELEDINHSIFDDSNDIYLKDYLDIDSKFILAWGVDKRLAALSEKALKKLKQLYGTKINVFGYKHPNRKNAYYHPLRRLKNHQKEWVSIVTYQLKT